MTARTATRAVRQVGAIRLPLERVYAITGSMGQRRLRFRAFPGDRLVTIHTDTTPSVLVGRLLRAGDARPHFHLEDDFFDEFFRKGRRPIHRLAAALYRTAEHPESLSLVPAMPGPNSEWFNVQGTPIAFTPNVSGRSVSLYAEDDDGPRFVAQVAKISDDGQADLRLGEAWAPSTDPDTCKTVIAAAYLVWDQARMADHAVYETEEVGVLHG